MAESRVHRIAAEFCHFVALVELRAKWGLGAAFISEAVSARCRLWLWREGQCEACDAWLAC